jgi:hypothetical protein
MTEESGVTVNRYNVKGWAEDRGRGGIEKQKTFNSQRPTSNIQLNGGAQGALNRYNVTTLKSGR